jgi:hypothetical protein
MISPIAEVGGLLAVAVAATTILQRIGSWWAIRRNQSRERWFLGWTRAGEYGDEHFAAMLARHLKEARKR